MRNLILGCVLLAGALLVIVQRPSTHVNAQEKQAEKPRPQSAAPAHVANSKVDPAKEADIRELMNVTGTSNLGDQLMKAGMDQFRANVTESQPDNPRAKQFAEAFVARFQKHFDPSSLTDNVIPIYDKYLSSDDLKELLQYYKSPLGQRMLKVLPEIARESQSAGFSLGQKAAQETLDELKAEYPEFVPNAKEEEKNPGGATKNP